MKGNLCIKNSVAGIYAQRMETMNVAGTNYFCDSPGLNYFTGDGALKESEGNYRITRVVLMMCLTSAANRIGTAEVENAINMHSGVVESAVVGYPMM